MAAVQHWHAIKRELWTLGRDEEELDQGTLPVLDLVSVVLSCGTDSALFRLMDGWSKTDQLLANMQEQQAGLIDLQRRHPRPGVPLEPARDLRASAAAQDAARRGVRRTQVEGFQSMDLQEWLEFKAKNHALGDALEIGRRNQARTDAALQRAAETKKAQDKLRQNALMG